MTSKARSTGTNKKTTSNAPKSGVTPVDQELLDQAAQEDSEGAASTDTLPSMKAAKSPAEVLAEQKAKIAEANKVPIPRLPTERHPASDAAAAAGRARQTIRDLAVPMTLGEICDVIGTEVQAEDFATSAFESLGDQIYTLAALVESDSASDSWRLFRDLSARAKLAARVQEFLNSEDETSAEAAQ